MKSLIIRLSIFAVIGILFTLIINFTPINQLFTYQRINGFKAFFNGFISENYLLAVLLFILTYIIITSSSIPGALGLSILGGFFFGPFWAVLYINIGSTIGGYLVFMAARYLMGESLQKKYSTQLTRLNNELDQNGQFYLFTIRLIPFFPFFIINLLSGLTKVKPSIYIITTILGVIPGSFVYAYLGYTGSQWVPGKQLIEPQVFMALILLGLMGLIPVIYKKYKMLKKRTILAKEENRDI